MIFWSITYAIFSSLGLGLAHSADFSTVKLLINAGSPINAGSLLNAGGYLSNVQINAGSLINAGSPINAGFQIALTCCCLSVCLLHIDWGVRYVSVADISDIDVLLSVCLSVI